MPEETDYESTLGTTNGGEPTAVVPAEPVTPPATPVVPEPAVPPVVEEELELGPDGQPVLDEAGQPKKKMGGFQRRIEKLSRKLQEKDQELEFLRRYAVPQATGQAATQAPPTTVQSQSAAEPNRDDFESNEEYIQALVKHTTEVAFQKFQQTQAQTQVQQTAQEREQKFRQQLTQAPAKYKDWADVMEDTTAPSTPVMDQIIKQSEVGIDLMYYLAKNEAEAVRISQLPDPLAQAMALGVIESQFKTAQKQTTQPTTPKASAAPPPITPVTATTTSVTKPPEQMDGDEYLEHMRQTKKKR